MSSNGTMRVLALHGNGTNATIMERQTSQLRQALGDRAEWHFLDAPLPVQTFFESKEHRALAEGKPLLTWYRFTRTRETADQRPVPLQLADLSTDWATEEVEPAVDYILHYIKEKGPFQVLIGFSQGAAACSIAAALLRERGEPIPWRLNVLFSGMRQRDERYYQAFSPPLSLPSVQIFGRSDPFYAFCRTWLPQMYKQPLILEHDEGHKFPSAQPRASEIYQRIAQEMLRHGRTAPVEARL